MLTPTHSKGRGGIRRLIVQVPLQDTNINEKDATVQNKRKNTMLLRRSKRNHRGAWNALNVGQRLEGECGCWSNSWL